MVFGCLQPSSTAPPGPGSAEDREAIYGYQREEQVKIVKACHVDPAAGHMGIKKTINRITEHFIWPGIVKDVKAMVCVVSLTAR